MRKTFINLFSAIITAIWIAPGVMAQEVVKHKELPRFHRINEKLYRGAQPRDGGLMRLRQLGVKTVINLRGSNEDTRSEEKHARTLGLNYFNVPLDRIGRPSDAKVQRVLAILNAPENQPVFVHCNHGRDRTGLIIAIYRLANEGWTAEEAQREANRHGMFWWKFGLKNYIRDYYTRTRRGALMSPRNLGDVRSTSARPVSPKSDDKNQPPILADEPRSERRCCWHGERYEPLNHTKQHEIASSNLRDVSC